MSLILEALKKSEAERRLGQAPGLLSPTPRISHRRPAPWILVSVAVVALAGVLASAWWLGRSGAWAPEPATHTDPAPAPAQRTVATSPEPTPAAAPEQIAPPPRRQHNAAASTDPATRRPPHPDPSLAGSVPAPAATATPAAAGDRSGSTEPDPSTSPATSPPAYEPESAAPAADVPPIEALPTLRELAAAERAALPPLSITMHVYAQVPARRFVLIDGRRRSEGDRLAEGLVLEQIRRDGAVLNLRGRRFLLPRPG
ncbi:MAG TPA: general secretion pathway protein GspB [Xanthomonadaceae bacterium]|nr:general secretion pathway protein GspB [Xanthomonadaceae bacterium]